MDTSETYIKMCDCPEIQELMDKHEEGNFVFRKFIANRPHAAMREYTCIDITGTPNRYWLVSYGNGEPAGQWVSHYHDSDSPDYYGTEVIWLPRQDQLQAMVDYTKYPYYHLKTLLDWVYSDLDYTALFSTWEQLWLAFVMKEKHNKVWDGEGWKNLVY